MPIHPTRRQMIALTGAALLASPAYARGADPTQATGGRAFASHWRITGPAGADMDALRPAVEQIIAMVDRQMSPWRADSELSRFNAARRESPASGDLARVAGAALEIARASDGWFDPTVGPLVARWGFGPISTADAGQLGRWQGLSVAGDHLAKDAPGLSMDLCGIAKGRALDLIAAHLQAAGIGDALIDLGGELSALGSHPSGRDWQVAVEDPRPDHGGGAAGMRLPGGMAVATSGLGAQGYDIGGDRYSHIIDPRAARPVAGRLASVSVLAASAMRADGWATALLAAGADRGPELARAQGLAALFLFGDDAGLARMTTGGFDRYLI
ncbi:MAG: FAD:protein FMN transferase [Paracoccus sp. (in: a-proteobacteria)]|nr:FAD:protein FMN transferase [Paracoccus sp. (in: a-proteobacteria)]